MGQREHAVLGHRLPARGAKRAFVWVRAVQTDFHVGRPLLTDDAHHPLQLAAHVANHIVDIGRDVGLGEEFGWIDLASPNVFGIEVHDETAPDIEPGAFVHMPLQSQVADVDLLGLGRALDLDDVPLVAADRHQHVGTSVRAVRDEPRLVEGESPGHGHAGQFVDGVLLDHARAAQRCPCRTSVCRGTWPRVRRRSPCSRHAAARPGTPWRRPIAARMKNRPCSGPRPSGRGCRARRGSFFRAEGR